MRIWSFDEFALSQQDAFSRASSPVIAHMADAGASSAPMSRSESVSSEQDTDQFGARRNSVFSLESEFSPLGDDQAMVKLVVNPFNEDEFLAVSSTFVRLFASRNSEMHELLRWKQQKRTNGAEFTGAGFLTKTDIIFWDALGNIFSVCSSFSVEGGSAGMHLTRGLHAEMTGQAPKLVAAALETVFVGADSALGKVSSRPDTPVPVLVTYTSNHSLQTLSAVLPVPLSSVSGSANRPHVDPEDSISKPDKNWLGSSFFFEMNVLWTRWIDEIKPEKDITCALVTQTGRIALGLSDGQIRIISPMSLVCGYADGQMGLCEGHKSAITALFQWNTSVLDMHCHSKYHQVQPGIAKEGPSENGRSLLLSAARDLKIKVWDPITGECLYTFPCQSSPIVSMYSVMQLTKSVSWQQGHIRNQNLSRLLQSLVLAVASDNSAILISAVSLERVFAVPPYSEQPVRLTIGRNTGDLVLWYMDGFKRYVSLKHLWDHDGSNEHGSSKSACGESLALEPFPSYSLSLANSLPRLVYESVRKAVEIINYYVGKLPAQVGARFKPLSLLTLAQYWHYTRGTRQASACRVVLLVVYMCAPGVVDAEELHALIIVCVIGSDFQSLLPLTARSMAASMLQTLIVADRASVRSRMVAIELLSRGFSTFKAHIDCQLVIRKLLVIMMSVSEDSRGMGLAQGLGANAAANAAAVGSSKETRRTVSGVSVPALAETASHGPSAPGSRRPSHARAANEAAGTAGFAPTNTMSSVARAAVTSSAMRAMHHRRTRSRHKSIGEKSDSVGSTVSFSLVALAKSALLRISADDIALVASTISGILQASESIRERRGALQLIGLVAQKYAVLLYPFLDALVAAIVYAIEPKHATMRKMLIGAAGAALQGLVSAYPWVSFHPESQCLAVGCIDGRCTTFDLRTATRTAVYDSLAKAPVAAVAISPRGDRVASFVLGSGLLSIWDPSPSALAMFARSLFWTASDDGASSEPGSGTVTPSKTMVIPSDFLRNKDEVSMASLMDVAKLTWTADQTVLLRIHEASFSLSL
ncbi:hypothetical protein J3B02_002967 [Coemansia erecta]|nr:hypothetical protein J3B02_002967 [Coemansia erecta]